MLGDEETCPRMLSQGADPNKLSYYADEDPDNGPERKAILW
jgi:hypothetical protein